MMKMKSTITYKKWDIVLVPFPFTNLTTNKKRPALIISPDKYNAEEDVVITFITSRMDLKYRIGDYKIEEWELADLPKPSMIRMKFATLDKSIIINKLGKLSENDRDDFSKQLLDFFKR
jgi:mRNA-degrading endonuclease toxin of MazEF toxin-antitoxin module